MKFRILSAVISVCAIFALGCNSQPTNRGSESQPRSAAEPSPTAQVDELVKASEQYAKNCIVCHGEKGEGGTKKIDEQTIKVPSLREGHALEHSDQEMVKQVLDGGDGMPPFKEKLSTKEAADLVRYIKREFQYR